MSETPDKAARLSTLPERTRPLPEKAGRRAPWLPTAPKVLDVVARAACLLAGFALVVSGVVGLFARVNSGALIAVLIAGGLLLLTPTVVDRLESLGVGPDGVRMSLLKQVAATGARRGAEALHRLGLGSEIDTYARIYTELSGDSYREIRARVLDRIVEQVAGASAVEKFDQQEVRSMFEQGTPVMRVLALGLMEGDLSLVDGDVLLEGVSRSLTGNEQYHALKLTLRAWDRLAPPVRQALKAAIAHSVHVESGQGRRALAEQILALPD